MTVFDTSALTRPSFTDADFTATKWDSAAEKTAFANALCRFMSADFRESLFTQKLHRRLALSFGHIAHFERGCFYNHFFRDLHGKMAYPRRNVRPGPVWRARPHVQRCRTRGTCTVAKKQLAGRISRTSRGGNRGS
jgi:hypothetical protein